MQHLHSTVAPWPSEDSARERAREIYCQIEDRPISSRNAAKIADSIEDLIRSGGWVPGDFVGTEIDLAQSFHVGRRSIRQAGRVLSARGTVSVRRGKVGGFWVSDVPRTTAISALNDAFPADCDRCAIGQEALGFLAPALSRHRGPAARLAEGWLKDLVLPSPTEGREDSVNDDSRAQRIARLILRSLASDDCAHGRRLGSLDELSEKYSAGLPVVIQAVRILEDLGAVSSKRGRSGGIVCQSGGTAMGVRTGVAHLSSEHASVEECDGLVRAVNIALIDLACRRLNAVTLARLEAALGGMERSSSATQLGIRWYVLQRAISDAAMNPALHALARCFAGQVVLQRVQQPDLSESQARALLEASRLIVANTRRGILANSVEAHMRCQAALRKSW